MRRAVLIRRIREAAQQSNVSWGLLRQGANHEIWQCGATRVAIPRHREINEHTAAGIYTHLEGELGKDWWRR